MIVPKLTMSRRTMLRLMAASTVAALSSRSACRAADVPWLDEVTIPPPNPPNAEIGPFAPLLLDRQGQPITTLAEWQAERQRLRDRWLEFLGPMPTERPGNTFEVLKEERLPTFTRTLVRYAVEADQPGEGYLLRPNGPAPQRGWPGLCGMHATTNETIDQIAGVSGNPTRQLGPKLAERGFVMFCPRNFLWHDVSNFNDAVSRFQKRHPGTLGMHKMLFDARRGVDILASLPDVDPRRLGAVGHSLGAKEALYLAAFDERIQAAVASEGGLGLRSTNWNAPWYLGPAIQEPTFALNHHQVLALIAPRAFLVLAGESGPGAADGERNWPLLRPAQEIYRLYDVPVRLGQFNHRQGHDIPDVALTRLIQWLERYLTVAS